MARLGRPWGLAGELRVQLHTDWPAERFAPGRRLSLEWDDGRRGEAVVKRFRDDGSRVLVALEGVDDPESARSLTNAWVLAAPDDLPRLDAGEVHQAQLEGMRVVTADGSPVGTVLRVEEGVGQDRAVVRVEADGSGREVLVPLVAAICPEIDTARGRLVIDPPAGLLEPDAAETVAPDGEALP